MEWQPININEQIKVKLKPEAIQLLKKEHEKFYKEMGLDREFVAPKVDNEGYSSYQLWDFMKTFGGTISLLEPTIFETTILVPTDHRE